MMKNNTDRRKVCNQYDSSKKLLNIFEMLMGKINEYTMNYLDTQIVYKLCM